MGKRAVRRGSGAEAELVIGACEDGVLASTDTDAFAVGAYVGPSALGIRKDVAEEGAYLFGHGSGGHGYRHG